MLDARSACECVGASIAAGWAQHATLHPLDTLKLRLQYARGSMSDAVRSALMTSLAERELPPRVRAHARARAAGACAAARARRRARAAARRRAEAAVVARAARAAALALRRLAPSPSRSCRPRSCSPTGELSSAALAATPAPPAARRSRAADGRRERGACACPRPCSGRAVGPRRRAAAARRCARARGPRHAGSARRSRSTARPGRPASRLRAPGGAAGRPRARRPRRRRRGRRRTRPRRTRRAHRERGRRRRDRAHRRIPRAMAQRRAADAARGGGALAGTDFDIAAAPRPALAVRAEGAASLYQARSRASPRVAAARSGTPPTAAPALSHGRRALSTEVPCVQR